MPITAELADELANGYLAAELLRQPIAPIREQHPDLSEEDAYAIQAALVSRKLAGGLAKRGYKCGATNQGAMTNFGLGQPVYAPLFDSGYVRSGASIERAALIHPRLECEVCFRMGSDLRGPGVTPEQAQAAAEAVCAAFEIVDSRTVGWNAKMAEMIGDNVFAARYVLSEQWVPAGGIDLAVIEAIVHKNGTEAARAMGSNVLGGPAISLAWLANRLADHGHYLAAGEIVMAGSLTALVPIEAGDAFVATMGGLGEVRVTFG
jgi:2-oxopent-4-enoate/cis-2-oxohex-4-enoate hydratase